MKSCSLFFVCLVFCFVGIFCDQGNLNPTIGPFAVDFTIKSIWNRNYDNIIYCGSALYNPSINSTGCPTSLTLLGSQDGTPRFTYLDTNQTEYPLSLTVSSLSTAADPRNWIAGYIRLSRNYSGPGPWQVKFSGCCLAKSPQQPFSLVATVDFHHAGASPSIAVLPAVSIPAAQSFWIPALSTAMPLRWSLDQVANYSGNLEAITLNATTGLLTVPAGVVGSAYLTVHVSAGGASSPVIFALDCGTAAVAPLVSVSPAPDTNISGNLFYTFYTGFPVQVAAHRGARPRAREM